MPEQLRSRIQLLLPPAVHCAAVDFKRQPVRHECLHGPPRRQKVTLTRLIEKVATICAREIIEARDQIEVPDKRRVQARRHHRLEAIVVRRQGVEVATIVLPALVMEHANVSIHADQIPVFGALTVRAKGDRCRPHRRARHRHEMRRTDGVFRTGHTRRVVDIVQLRTSEDIDSVAVRRLQTTDFLRVGRVVHRDAWVHMPAEAEMGEALLKCLLHHGLRRVGAIAVGGMRMIICF